MMVKPVALSHIIIIFALFKIFMFLALDESL